MAAAPAPEAETAAFAVDSIEEAPPSPPSPPPPPAPEEPADLRTDFAETAFWEPHLLTAEDGSVSFEFTVPDSVTEWNVWVHALTRDLRAGSLERRARSVKELMVRPYLPRFFREGDRAELVHQIQLTLLHEIGHHFGFTEEEMEAWETEFAGLAEGQVES